MKKIPFLVLALCSAGCAIGDGHLPPRSIEYATAKCEKPSYPPHARRSEVTGSTVVEFVVDAEGKVSDIRVHSKSGESAGHRSLDMAAQHAVATCRYPPAPGHAAAKGKVTYDWRLTPGQLVLPSMSHLQALYLAEQTLSQLRPQPSACPRMLDTPEKVTEFLSAIGSNNRIAELCGVSGDAIERTTARLLRLIRACTSAVVSGEQASTVMRGGLANGSVYFELHGDKASKCMSVRKDYSS